MNQNLVLTIAAGDFFDKVKKLTHPTIKKYATKINADFLELTELTISDPKWEKTKIFELLNKYKRIIYFDSDLIIREDCPNLFELVNEKELGVLNEKKYTLNTEKLKIEAIKYNIQIEKITNDYFNTGVMVISRQHKFLFKKPKSILGGFDEYFNLILKTNSVKTNDLNYRFNRMHFQDSHCGIARHDSYIIHYSKAPTDLMLDLIPKDLHKWKEDKPTYKYERNIVVSVSAGMGDQLCSEPAIRYLTKLYSDSKLYIITHFPRLFEHLEIPTFTHENWQGLSDPHIKFHTCPDDENSNHNLSHALFHPTDFASMSMYRKTIPNISKTINLKVEPDDVSSVLEMVKERNKNKPVVLVHAGKWWPSKTLPTDWWQLIVNKLSDKLTVVLIGKELSDDQGYLPLELPTDGIDLRDVTSLGEFIALISLSKLLLTNDSSPLHIAGAFDNWVVVVPTCKHPDHILPFRNGTQSYKTKALYKKLLIDDLEVRHTEIKINTIDQIPEGKTMYDYIPDVSDVVSEIFKVYEV